MISLLILLTIIAPTLTQYASLSNGMRPDVTFNDDNDRYDVTNIVIDQNSQFPEPKKYRRREDDARRILKKGLFRRKDASSDISSIEKEPYPDSYYKLPTKKIKKQFTPLLKLDKIETGFTGDFAYHDKMETGEYDTDYEKHLLPLQISRRKLDRLVDLLHGGKVGGRRNMEPVNPEDEILFHHAVPVKMTINGYLVSETNRR